MEENTKKQICHKCCHKYILLRVIGIQQQCALSEYGMFYGLNSNTIQFYQTQFLHHIKSFIRFHLAFVFGLQTYYLIDFSKRDQWLKSQDGHIECIQNWLGIFQKCPNFIRTIGRHLDNLIQWIVRMGNTGVWGNGPGICKRNNLW